MEEGRLEKIKKEKKQLTSVDQENAQKMFSHQQITMQTTALFYVLAERQHATFSPLTR